MSADELFRLRLQALVARGLGATAIAAQVGLAAASEVWGGERPRERPAWYLWLRGAAGAYQVELAGAAPIAGAGGSPVLGRFTVRYYPPPDGVERLRFSPEEQDLVASALDGTGTPRIELASAIPDALFTIGSVEWALDPDGGASVFALASLDRIRTRDRQRMVRDVPGWRLAAPVFSLLAGLYAQVERRAASRLVISRRAGFELLATPDGGAEPRDTLEAAYGEAFLIFPSQAPADTGAGLLQALRDPDAALVEDVALDPAARAAVLAADPRLALPVSHAWFGGAAHPEDHVACAC